MKTGLLKRGFLGVACALALLVSLPFAALADDGPQPAGGGAEYTFELTGYEYGRSVDGIGVTCDSSGVRNIDDVMVYESRNSATGDVSKPAKGRFKAGQSYYLKFTIATSADVDGGSLKRGLALKTGKELCEAKSLEILSDTMGYVVVFELPKLDAVPFSIPFTKIVEQTGDVAPGESSFELEVANVYKETNSPIGQFEVGGSFSTEGAGSAEQHLSIKNNDFDKVLGLLSEGILVSERNLGAEGWTYDDAVWCVRLGSDPAGLVDDFQSASSPFDNYLSRLELYKGEMVNGEFVSDGNDSAKKMVFTNGYSEQGEESCTPAEESVEKNVDTAAEPAALAQTGDSANAGLLTALLLASGLGAAGAAYGARRKLAE